MPPMQQDEQPTESVTQQQPAEPQSVTREDEHHEGEAEQQQQQVLDPATATPEDLVDDETRQSYDNILATQKFIATSIEEQRALLLQQAEIADLLERADELGKCEYFDVRYFTEQAKLCWKEREMADAAPSVDRPNAVRLFPNQEHVDRQRELRNRLREDHALEDREALKQRHPLLFNRVVRDESRRALFDSAVMARRNFETRSATDTTQLLLLDGPQKAPALRTASAVHNDSNNSTSHIQSCAVTLSKPTKAASYATKPFGSVAAHVRHNVQSAAEQSMSATSAGGETRVDVSELMSDAQQIVDRTCGVDSDSSTPVVPPAAPPTLQQMLSQQRTQLKELQERDETVYQPLLDRYLAFNEAVKERLFAMAE